VDVDASDSTSDFCIKLNILGLNICKFYTIHSSVNKSDWQYLLFLSRFEYPQPTFQKLMKEQIMEPFFVFQVTLFYLYILIILPTYISLMALSFFMQVFCVALWCLDEYWYYSLFTLFMLFLFESTMAKNRLKTLTELRRVKVDNQIVLTYRRGKYGPSFDW